MSGPTETKFKLTDNYLRKYPHIMTAPVESLGYRELMMRYQFQNTLDMYRGKPSAWCNYLIPAELFHAMDIIPFVLENEAALLARTKQSKEFLDVAYGLTGFQDICSYQRAALGAFALGFLPSPTLLVNTTMPCDSVGKLCELLSLRHNVPNFLLDIPYDMDEDAVEYLAGGIREMVSFMESVVGEKMEPERLRSALDLANKAREEHVRANELRAKHEPLVSGTECLGMFATAIITLGSETGLLVYGKFREQLEKIIETRSDEERNRLKKDKRIVWYHFKPFFNDKLLYRMENEMGARIVFEGVNDVYWQPYDLDKPFESLARKLLSMMLNGPINLRLENFLGNAKKFRADGVINFLHFGCRHYNNGKAPFEDACNKAGIPYLEVYGDCIDPSNYSEAPTATRIAAFVECLNER